MLALAKARDEKNPRKTLGHRLRIRKHQSSLFSMPPRQNMYRSRIAFQGQGTCMPVSLMTPTSPR